MTKYSVEFKMNIVQDYLNGEGGTPYLAKKYGIKGDSQVRNWVKNLVRKVYFIVIEIKLILFNSS